MSPLAALPNALLFAFLGLLLFLLIATAIFQSALRDLWRRAVDENEIGPAIIVAAVLLSIAAIISATVH